MIVSGTNGGVPPSIWDVPVVTLPVKLMLPSAAAAPEDRMRVESASAAAAAIRRRVVLPRRRWVR